MSKVKLIKEVYKSIVLKLDLEGETRFTFEEDTSMN